LYIYVVNSLILSIIYSNKDQVKIKIFILFLFFCNLINAQNVAINNDGSSAVSSAILDIKSVVKGMLIPRMSKIEKNGILTPATGLLVFQNSPDSIGFHYYNGVRWVYINAESNIVSVAWKITGNILPANSFLGSTNDYPLKFKVNNVNSGIIDSSYFSVGFGFRALDKNINYSNSAFGHKALSSNIGGSGNTAVGNGALENNISGNNNTAIGNLSLQMATNSQGNTAIGILSLNKNTSGTDNTGVGYTTLFQNSTGSLNTAIGSQALGAYNMENNNTAVGAYSSAFTTGQRNTALGTFALHLNTSGSFNTAIGEAAGKTYPNDSLSTFIGYNSNAANDNLKNSTAIGANSFVSSSNSLILGSILGVNSATSNTNIGIGTTSPISRLEVTGAENTNSLVKIAQQGTSSALTIFTNNGIGLELDNSTIKVSGANKSAFQVTSTGSNTIIIPNAIANNSSDIIFITHKKITTNVDPPVGVFWNGTNWIIYTENNVAIPINEQFNVLVIKQ
jgi:hypothetical protein